MVDVLLVAGSFYPREGGAERQLRSILAQLAAEGLEVAVVTQVIPGSAHALPDEVDGISVHRVGSAFAFRVAPKLGQLIFTLSAFARATRMAPSIIISLQMGTASGAAAAAARVRKVPHIVRLTGGSTAKHRSEPIARASTRTGRIWARFFMGRGTVVVAPAHHLLNDFTTAFPSFRGVVRYIPNGVVLPASDPAKTSDVLWYARSGSEQSSETIVEIARRLPSVKFSIMGRANLTPATTNISVLGWQTEPEIVIGAHRVLVNTSANEGMPNTVLQAVAWRSRVVGFDNPGMNEIRRSYPDSVALVPVGDIERAAAEVRTALGQGMPPQYTVTSVLDAKDRWTDLIAGLMRGHK